MKEKYSLPNQNKTFLTQSRLRNKLNTSLSKTHKNLNNRIRQKSSIKFCIQIKPTAFL